MELSLIKPSSLSVGATVRSALLADARVASMVKVIAPLAVPGETPMPYIIYGRGGYSQTPVKGVRGSDELQLDIFCIAGSYGESIAIAEAVRAALDGVQITPSTPELVPVRGCYFSGGDGESLDGEGFVQSLAFTIRV